MSCIAGMHCVCILVSEFQARTPEVLSIPKDQYKSNQKVLPKIIMASLFIHNHAMLASLPDHYIVCSQVEQLCDTLLTQPLKLTSCGVCSALLNRLRSRRIN